MSALRRVDRAMEKVAACSYETAKLYYKTRFLLGREKDRLLVYTVGKVGSTTVAASLRASGLDLQILHLHWLVPEPLRRDDALYRRRDRQHRGTSLEQRFRPRYVWLGECMAERVKRAPRGGGSWRIVTLVRDPVARNISSFFQNLELFFEFDLGGAIAEHGEQRVVDLLIALFLDSYRGESVATRHDGDPLTWFDVELKEVFDVDVYAQRFPVERGYDLYRTPRAEVLLLRLEDLARCANAAFREFVGLESFTLKRRNVGADKAYSGVYRRFLKEIRLPESYLSRLYESKYARHFYTDRELMTFRAHWTRAS